MLDDEDKIFYFSIDWNASTGTPGFDDLEVAVTEEEGTGLYGETVEYFPSDFTGTINITEKVLFGSSALGVIDFDETVYTFNFVNGKLIGDGEPIENDKAIAAFTNTYLAPEAVKYTVIYEPGLHGIFTAVTHSELPYGIATPTGPIPLGEEGWVFVGWSPLPASTVTEDAIYVAQWEPGEEPFDEPLPDDDLPKTGDNITTVLLITALAGVVFIVNQKKTRES